MAPRSARPIRARACGSANNSSAPVEPDRSWSVDPGNKGTTMAQRIGIIAAVLLAVSGCATTPSDPVFFAQDATVLTPEAQAVVTQIVQRSAAEHPARI